MRRIIAGLIDIEIIGIIIDIFAKIAVRLFTSQLVLNLLSILLIIFGIYLLLMKDCIFGYESIGKKIMGLKIYQNGYEVKDKKLLFNRNKITLIYSLISLPKLVLLGKTDGDTKYNTEVKYARKKTVHKN